MLSGEATNTNFIVFGLIRPGREPTIYRTRGEHADNYGTDAVLIYRHLSRFGDFCVYYRAVLLNIFGVVVLLLVTCLAGIVVFAYYNAIIGCDPLANKEVSNSNQVGMLSKR